jgi:hypothetical protein
MPFEHEEIAVLTLELREAAEQILNSGIDSECRQHIANWLVGWSAGICLEG